MFTECSPKNIRNLCLGFYYFSVNILWTSLIVLLFYYFIFLILIKGRKGQNTDHAHSQQNEENNANGGNEETGDYQEDTETEVSNIFLWTFCEHLYFFVILLCYLFTFAIRILI